MEFCEGVVVNLREKEYFYENEYDLLIGVVLLELLYKCIDYEVMKKSDMMNC